MLNGIAPLLIFNFKRKVEVEIELAGPSQSNATPLLATADVTFIPLIPVPLYLDEKITGVYVISENKNIDIQTVPLTNPDGATPEVQQYGLNTTIDINMLASKNSIGMSLLLAMSDLIFEKVTSKEYSVTYLNGSVIMFNALLDSFSVNQNNDNDLYNINLKLSRATGSSTVEKVAPTTVPKLTGTTPLTAVAP
jgi:hypothetical protein